MLQAFIGTYDAAGLRALRSEDEIAARSHPWQPQAVRFWAIVDSDQLPQIHHAIALGDRRTALQLLIQTAKSLGPIDRRSP